MKALTEIGVTRSLATQLATDLANTGQLAIAKELSVRYKTLYREREGKNLFRSLVLGKPPSKPNTQTPAAQSNAADPSEGKASRISGMGDQSD